jgi:hypothetical protein
MVKVETKKNEVPRYDPIPDVKRSSIKNEKNFRKRQLLNKRVKGIERRRIVRDADGNERNTSFSLFHRMFVSMNVTRVSREAVIEIFNELVKACDELIRTASIYSDSAKKRNMKESHLQTACKFLASAKYCDDYVNVYGVGYDSNSNKNKKKENKKTENSKKDQKEKDGESSDEDFNMNKDDDDDDETSDIATQDLETQTKDDSDTDDEMKKDKFQ